MVAFNRQPLDLGSVTVSPAVFAAIGRANVRALLIRHAAGDWGEADAEVAGENLRAIVTGRGLVSGVFRVAAGAVLIVTDLERRETSVLFAEEI